MGFRKISPSKSRSISIVKGVLRDIKFCIGDEPIPTESEQLVKSLGRWNNADLKDKEQVQLLRQETVDGLENINKTLLHGKLKLLCLQFGLLPRTIWPLTVYEDPITTVDGANHHLICGKSGSVCLSNINLYGKGGLQRPFHQECCTAPSNLVEMDTIWRGAQSYIIPKA